MRISSDIKKIEVLHCHPNTFLDLNNIYDLDNDEQKAIFVSNCEISLLQKTIQNWKKVHKYVLYI